MNEQQRQQQIIQWIEQDEMRMLALRTARQLTLNDWCLAAGFVRNLIWDRLHGFSHSSPLNDIDVIYFNSQGSYPPPRQECCQYYEVAKYSIRGGKITAIQILRTGKDDFNR